MGPESLTLWGPSVGSGEKMDRTRDCCLDKMPSFQCSVSVIARIICVWNISITNELELKVLTAGLVLKIQSSVSSPV